MNLKIPFALKTVKERLLLCSSI